MQHRREQVAHSADALHCLFWRKHEGFRFAVGYSALDFLPANRHRDKGLLTLARTEYTAPKPSHPLVRPPPRGVAARPQLDSIGAKQQPNQYEMSRHAKALINLLLPIAVAGLEERVHSHGHRAVLIRPAVISIGDQKTSQSHSMSRKTLSSSKYRPCCTHSAS
jgi:hypothetical protein